MASERPSLSSWISSVRGSPAFTMDNNNKQKKGVRKHIILMGITKRCVAEQAYLSLLTSCKTLVRLTQIHALILKLNLHHNPLILTKFTATSSHFDVAHYAASFIFLDDDRPAPHREAFLFNTLIRAFAHSTAHSKPCTLCLYYAMLCPLRSSSRPAPAL
ncbi:hypothetical protein Fmac_010980 [Flemingia macrophylla]|uniref:Uncharacterized protein n=1 Tax=Flemingia macrophylla TaxID=520843 RepID=A0ABD1ML59_9FABA